MSARTCATSSPPSTYSRSVQLGFSPAEWTRIGEDRLAEPTLTSPGAVFGEQVALIQKAIGAVARHLADATYWILTKQETYREPNAAAVSSTGDKRG